MTEAGPLTAVGPETSLTVKSAVDLVVIGLGYVGLPLASGAVDAGMSVMGLDVSERVVRGLNSGRSHVDDLSHDRIVEMLGGGFRATTESQVIRSANAIVICVPTPLGDDGGPNLTAVREAAWMVAKNLAPGALVVLESTTYPGTTDEVVRPILETSGMSAGRDFSLAFSPERIDPGNSRFGLANTPKVVGGYTQGCAARAAEFYQRLVERVVLAKGTREAEMAKLLENTYRHVNIALVNEMSRFCQDLGIDIWNVIDCASSKPFGFQPFYPGPGVGGHCIPVDPNYLSYSVRTRLGYPFRFVELAQEINSGVPRYVMRRIQDLLNSRKKSLSTSSVLLLGVTYKENIADQRESPAKPLARLLAGSGAAVSYHDPYVPVWNYGAGAINCVPDLDAALQACDLAVLLQAHEQYVSSDGVRGAALVFDTRRVTNGRNVSHL
ncbi:MAG: nucleotide sugar dehydrogenase [Actinomycetales bacterium]|nr:nucleotide sugar dehydrogenase [Actinomycetales bacterium]